MKNLSLLLLLLTSILSCQKQAPKSDMINQDEIEIPGPEVLADTTDGKPYIAILPKTANQNIPVIEKEMKTIDSLLQAAVAIYNRDINKKYVHNKKDNNTASGPKRLIIDLRYYKRQYITSINKEGEKEIWVNCFCSTNSNHWQQHIEYVNDGGKCYFQVTINLTKKSYHDFAANGEV